MLIKTLEVGHLQENCYVVTDEKSGMCAVIDPGDESTTIMDYIEDNKLTVKAIMLTHGHFDHTGAVETIAEETGAPVYIHRNDVSFDNKPEELQYKFRNSDDLNFYKEQDDITVGGLKFYVIETPGHSSGSVTLLCENALFTGDTLFRGSCGRTDLPSGDMHQLLRSLKRLSDFPGDFEVYPGHDWATTLNHERNFNYYVKYANGEQ